MSGKLNRIRARMLEDLGGINVDTGAVENYKEWEATEGQTNFIIDNGNYKVGSKTLEVVVDSIPQPPSVITEISSTEFALDEGVPAGTPVFARWTEFTLPVGSYHKDSHYAGGYDELDMTKFAGYLTNVGTPISNLTKDMTDVKAGKYGGSVKESVATTQGRFWQTSIEQLNATIGGLKYQLRTIPTTAKKTIVLLGSSSAQGNGVADYNTTSFWALLRDKLSPLGYNVVNRGFSADDTADGIGRFYRDVVTLSPEYVILAFTLGNEGMTNAGADLYAEYNQFKDGILKMCYMAKQAGITPIVMTQAPTKSYTLPIYQYSQQFNAELDAAGFHAVDWGGVVDAQTGDGQPILSIMYDNVHYKEAAHKEIANAFPTGFFDKAMFENGSYLTTKKGTISTNTLTSTSSAVPISTPVTDVTTFTMFMRFKTSALALATVMSMSGGIRAFIDASGQIIWNDGPSGSVTAATGNWADGAWHSIGITYSPIDQKMKLFMDGVLKYTITSTIVPDRMGFAGRVGSTSNLKNAEIKDMAYWRTRIPDEKMMMLHHGVFPQTSLEVFSPGHDKILKAGTPLVNLAASTVTLRVDPSETALTATANPSM